MNPGSKPAAAPLSSNPLRERLRAETARSIIGAAEKVFAAQGLRAARMDDIATEAGVSVGTVYNHFEDRESLLKALLDTRRAELVADLDAALEEGSGEPFQFMLERFASTVLEHFESHRPFFSIVIEGEHQPATGRPNDTMREVYKRVEHLMTRGLRKKALRPQGAELWPALFMGAVRGLMVHSLSDKSAARPLGERAPDLVRFFLDGAGA
jgi:AcrR family transcriptional regulator